MTTRRQFALDLGGRFLVRTLLRRWPNPANRFRTTVETRKQVEQQRLSELEHEFLDKELPDWMTEPAELLDDAQRAFIRDKFYSLANMNAAVLRSWIYDPRVLDGLNPVKKGLEARRVRARLRVLARIWGSARPNGVGWSHNAYDAARAVIFVVSNLLRVHQIDYETWVVLKNYGHDWTKFTRYQPRRHLPPLVALEAQLALVKYKNAGKPRDWV